MLRTRGVRNLVLTGVTTDVCVHTTMRNANDMGYECVLLEVRCVIIGRASSGRACVLSFDETFEPLLHDLGPGKHLKSTCFVDAPSAS